MVNAAHQLQSLCDPGWCGVQDPVLGERSAQAPERRNGNQQVAQFQGAQGKQQGLIVVLLTVQGCVHGGLPLGV
ncbi:hypothetical protein D3C73_1520940 [compost metagenome]